LIELLQQLQGLLGVEPAEGPELYVPPYPLVPKPGADLGEFEAMRFVVSGQLFGDHKIPEA
jgi:hypothetical protein